MEDTHNNSGIAGEDGCLFGMEETESCVSGCGQEESEPIAVIHLAH